MHYVPPPADLQDAHADRIRTFAFAGFVGFLLLLNVAGVFRTLFGIDTAAILTLLAGYRVNIYKRPTTFALNVSNLFEKEYYRSTGIATGSWGEPRSFRLTVSTDF